MTNMSNEAQSAAARILAAAKIMQPKACDCEHCREQRQRAPDKAAEWLASALAVEREEHARLKSDLAQGKSMVLEQQRRQAAASVQS